MASDGQMKPSGAAEGAGLGGSHGSTETLSSSAVNRLLMEFLIYFGRAMFVLYPVYLTGYLGLSVSWVLLCMMMVTWWKKNRQWKDARIGTAIDFVDNETQVVHKELESALQMASWVHFPDVEKVDWVNKVLQQAWPFFGMYMEKLLKENIEPAVRLSNPALKTFKFTKVHFGHIVKCGCPLRITGMKAYTHEVDQREVVLDLNICYDGDVDIDALVKEPITAGVKGLKLKGMIRVILEPLIGEAPLVGGVTLFFIRRPTLEINWTGMTNLLDSPAFSSLSEGTIVDIIASLMVLPNRMCVPLVDQVKVDQMRFPLPRGVVRVHLLEARDLVAKDTYMMGLVKGKSDPYATLRVGNRHFKTKTIKENLHPKWNEVYEFVVHEWFPLDDVQNGEVHLKLQWLSLQTNPNLLMEIVFSSKDPVWEEGFTFFVHDIKTQQLSVQIKEPEKKTVLGVLNLPLSRLLGVSNMAIDQRFPLERSGANSQIKLKATLRSDNEDLRPTKELTDLDPVPPPLHPPLQNFPPTPPPLPPSHLQPKQLVSRMACMTTNRVTVAAPSSRLKPGGHLHPRTCVALTPTACCRTTPSTSFDINKCSHHSRAIRKHQGSFGEIHLTVRYATLRNKLIVMVDACRNLFRCSENGTDSYVRLYLLPEQSWIHRKKTHVKKRSLNPVFNEKFEFDVSLEEAKTRKLDVAVKNNRMFHTRERKDIGMVMVDFSQLDLTRGITEWYEAQFSAFP
uniref:Extended synaptotagmin-like protein 3 n=1 Tax=Sparus aurata TaxID=8175 RepID=A0A671W6J2_SPAAU